MATTWIEADVPTLRRLALLVELVSRGEVSATHLSEIRHLEDRFGISPLARRRLEWEIEAGRDAAAVALAATEDESAAREATKGDGRWLRAVGDE